MVHPRSARARLVFLPIHHYLVHRKIGRTHHIQAGLQLPGIHVGPRHVRIGPVARTRTAGGRLVIGVAEAMAQQARSIRCVTRRRSGWDRPSPESPAARPAEYRPGSGCYPPAVECELVVEQEHKEDRRQQALGNAHPFARRPGVQHGADAHPRPATAARDKLQPMQVAG